MSEVTVFDDRTHYVGYVDLDDGQAGWYRWPAEAGGWALRKRLDRAPDVAAAAELAPFNAHLALKLTGAIHD